MNKIKAAKELENNGREFVRMRFKSELENLFPSHSLPFRERENERSGTARRGAICLRQITSSLKHKINNCDKHHRWHDCEYPVGVPFALVYLLMRF